MPSRLRPPEEVRIDLADGDWILVKKHLTFGEQRQAQTRLIKSLTPGAKLELDPTEVGVSLAWAYLLDWSVLDSAGKPIIIRDQPESVLRAALFGQDPELGQAIVDAITTHDAAMRELRETEKKDRAGATASSATSVSVA
jgi:hypothetical protein